VTAHFERGACFRPLVDALRYAGLVASASAHALDESAESALRRAA
jgi:hypothetical protein